MYANRFSPLSVPEHTCTDAKQQHQLYNTLDGRRLCLVLGCKCVDSHITSPLLVKQDNNVFILMRDGFLIPLHSYTNTEKPTRTRLEDVVTHVNLDCWTSHALTTVTRPIIDPDFWHGFLEDFLARFALANNENYRERTLTKTNDAKQFDDFINQRGWWGSVFFPLLTKIFKEVCDVDEESIYDGLARLIHANLDGRKQLDVFLNKFAEMTLENWREYQEERQQPWYLGIEPCHSNDMPRRGSFSE